MKEIILYITKDGIYYFFCIFIATYLSQRGYKVKFIKENKEIKECLKTKNHAIIPYGIEQQELFFNSKIYSILDNKSNCYKFLEKYNDILKDTKINLINSYTKDYIKNKNKNVKNKFIIKPNTGLGSKGIIYAEDYIYNLINEYPDYQIQDIINNECGYELSCVCKNGKVISSICIKTTIVKRSFISYIKGINGVVCYKKNLLEFAKKILENIKYNGFIEFEFIKENKKIYLMECNARLSGWVNNEYFFEKIIIPYLKEFYNINIKTNIIHSNNKNIIMSDIKSRFNLIKSTILNFENLENIENKGEFGLTFIMNLF
jgi:hypothetical protein